MELLFLLLTYLPLLLIFAFGAVRQQVNVGDLTYAASQTRRLDLPKELPLVGLQLHLNGDIVVTGATTNRDEAHLNLVLALRLMADGEAIQSWTLRNLSAYNYFTNGIANQNRTPATGVATNPFDAYLQLPLGFGPQRITGLPSATYMDASRFKSFQLECDWGVVGDVVSAGAATIDAGTIMTVDAVQLRERPGRLGLPNRLIRTANQIEDSGAINTAFRSRLSRDFETAFILVRVSDQATGFALSDALVLNAGVRLGTNFFLMDQLGYDRIKGWQKRFYRLSEIYPFGTPVAPTEMTEGFIMLSQLQSGMQDLFAPGAVNEFDLLTSVLAATRLDIQQIRIGPPK